MLGLGFSTFRILVTELSRFHLPLSHCLTVSRLFQSHDLQELLPLTLISLPPFVRRPTRRPSPLTVSFSSLVFISELL